MTKNSKQQNPPAAQPQDSNPANQPQLPGLQPGVQQLQVQGVMHFGPVPAPQVLAGYGHIDPSFPNRIVTMAEENARTERKTAERAQTFVLAERLCARILGLLFAGGSIGASAYLALQGHDTVAAIIAGTTVVAVTAAIINVKSP